jgi:hypothetical protein
MKSILTLQELPSSLPRAAISSFKLKTSFIICDSKTSTAQAEQ